jgi:WXXGXW repeat (2 copies)
MMKKILLSAACGLLLTAGIAQAQVAIRIGPPPPPREVAPARPYGHPDWVWRPGYQRWDGARYVWTPGSYAAPPRRGARWVPGHYRQTPRGYFWVEGHWR